MLTNEEILTLIENRETISTATIMRICKCGFLSAEKKINELLSINAIRKDESLEYRYRVNGNITSKTSST